MPALSPVEVKQAMMCSSFLPMLCFASCTVIFRSGCLLVRAGGQFKENSSCYLNEKDFKEVYNFWWIPIFQEEELWLSADGALLQHQSWAAVLAWAFTPALPHWFYKDYLADGNGVWGSIRALGAGRGSVVPSVIAATAPGCPVAYSMWCRGSGRARCPPHLPAELSCIHLRQDQKRYLWLLGFIRRQHHSNKQPDWATGETRVFI